MKRIAIIVLNWKTPKLTIDTINSLLKINHSSFKYHIYLVDNGSPDDSVSQFLTKFKNNSQISIVQTGSNLGYVEGNNFGIKEAQKKDYDYYLIINSDVEVQSDFLKVLMDFMEANPEYGIVGPKIYFAPGFEFHKDRYTKSQLGKVIWSFGSKMDWNNIYGSNYQIDIVDTGQFTTVNSNIDYLTGCCLLIKKDVIKDIGYFDPKYFMYLEDTDYSLRAQKAGYHIACVPESVIWHLNSGSSGRGSIHDYFLTRNRLLFGFRYASIRTKFALFRDSLRIFFTSPFVWQKYGVVDYYLHRFGKGRWQ